MTPDDVAAMVITELRDAGFHDASTSDVPGKVAALYEKARRESVVEEQPEANPEWEAAYEAAHAAMVAEVGVEPEQTLVMLKTWKASAGPANECGQVSFARAMLDSATDALEAALQALKLADALLSGANMNVRVVERKVRAALGPRP